MTSPQDWAWGHPLNGRAISTDVKQRLAPFRAELADRATRIAIVRFEPPTAGSDLELARYGAALTSMQQKELSFRSIGCTIEDIPPLPQNMLPRDFAALLDRLNQNPQVRGIIVQYPVPPQLFDTVPRIAPDKDLDALATGSPFPAPATSEAIVRLVEPFSADAIVAVVGARGFVGRGVVQQLRDRGVEVLAIDQRDLGFVPEDLLRVRNADIVVSATGQPELLDERHLTPYHRLVVDSGYVPLGDQTVVSDVRASARTIAQNYTPVPRGVGPTEMAVLMERLVRKELDPNLEAWRLTDTNPIVYFMRSQVQAQQLEWAQNIYPVAAAILTDRLRTQPASLQTSAAGAIVLEGANYSLVLDRTEGTFSIQGANGRGDLTVYDRQGTVISAAGLTAIDAANWTQIQPQRSSQQQEDDRER